MASGGFTNFAWIPGAPKLGTPSIWETDQNADCHDLLKLHELTGCEGQLRIEADVDLKCHKLENLSELTGCNGQLRIDAAIDSDINLTPGHQYLINGGPAFQQTPWLSDIDAAGYSLYNLGSYVSFSVPYPVISGPTELYLSVGSNIYFSTSSYPAMVKIQNNGCVGILNTSPLFPLDVNGNVNSTGCYYINSVPFACSDGAYRVNLSNIATINGAAPGDLYLNSPGYLFLRSQGYDIRADQCNWFNINATHGFSAVGPGIYLSHSTQPVSLTITDGSYLTLSTNYVLGLNGAWVRTQTDRYEVNSADGTRGWILMFAYGASDPRDGCVGIGPVGNAIGTAPYRLSVYQAPNYPNSYLISWQMNAIFAIWAPTQSGPPTYGTEMAFGISPDSTGWIQMVGDEDNTRQAHTLSLNPLGGDVIIGGDLIHANMPMSDPGPGSNKFWCDPSDGNRVKFSA